MDTQAIRRVLYVQHQPLGDVLCNTGVLPYLRRALPRATIAYLVQHPFEEVFAGNPNLDDVLVFRMSGRSWSVLDRVAVIRQVRSRQFDLIVDQACGTLTAQIALFSGAPFRLGYADSRRRFAYNIRAARRRERYSAAMKFDLLAPLGIDEGPYELEYAIRPESQDSVDRWLAVAGIRSEHLVCVAPGSKDPRKVWRPASFAHVCDAVQLATPGRVVLMGAGYERGAVQKVAAAMTTRPVEAPLFALNEAVALVKRARLLVCNDTALNHFSAVTRTPSLAVFGPSRPINWSPTTDPTHLYLHRPDRYRRGDASFGITPAEAAARVLEMLDGRLGLESRRLPPR